MSNTRVVTPLFFPGGNIGSLAVHRTVNDIAMCGGKPMFTVCGVPHGGLGAILVEIATPSDGTIVIDESSIPVKGEIRGICEILGFDPLFLANEGKLAVFCAPADADAILNTMKQHAYEKDATLIGTVVKKGRGQILLNTVIGGSRILYLPTGELVPRIC